MKKLDWWPRLHPQPATVRVAIPGKGYVRRCGRDYYGSGERHHPGVRSEGFVALVHKICCAASQ
jgi:hypothetical protein